MKLSKLLERLEYEVVQGSVETEVTTLANDSRKVESGSVFVCISGAVFDGHQYVSDVAKKGAAAIIAERDIEAPKGVTVIKAENTRYALALMSAAYFGYPAEKLKVIGITGTKGKTTTTYLIRSILEGVGHKVGLIGTIEAIIGDRKIPAANTTPESFTIQQYFVQMVEEGCDSVVMEVSSQGLMLHRTAEIPFEIGIFTNLGKDHIGPNEHKDFEDYKRCKAMLFQQCKLGIANIDDPYYEDIFRGATCKVETFGFSPKADLRAENVNLVSKPGYLGVSYHVAGKADFDVEIDIPGKFSVYNSLTAIAVCRHFGVPSEKITEALKTAHVKGRIEMIKVSDDFTLMIDYAHNAMSLESLLTTLKEYEPKRLVCVFGCGGNRSKDRRYEMGEVSGRLADLTIITSDNPRFEEPQETTIKLTKGTPYVVDLNLVSEKYCIGTEEWHTPALAAAHIYYEDEKGTHALKLGTDYTVTTEGFGKPVRLSINGSAMMHDLKIILDAFYHEEHDFDSESYSTVVTEGSCTVDKVVEHMCYKCGKTELETIPAPGHSYGDDYLQEVKDGKEVHYKKCEVCATPTEAEE